MAVGVERLARRGVPRAAPEPTSPTPGLGITEARPAVGMSRFIVHEWVRDCV